MSPSHPLRLPSRDRAELWRLLSEEFSSLIDQGDEPVFRDEALAHAPDLERAHAFFKWPTQEFKERACVGDAFAQVRAGLRSQLNTSSPMYFGVFNPAPSSAGVVGEALAALYNPQLASTVSAPFAVAVEEGLARFFAERFGFPEGASGHFCSGGTEANTTAILCALNHRIPGYNVLGSGCSRPRIYVSTETHHSIQRAAGMTGVGLANVVAVPVGSDLKLDPIALEAAIAADQSAGFHPIAVVATLGSTSAGVFDDVESICAVTRKHGLWLHVDAAWGGAAVLLPEHKGAFAGVERADSLTLDAHKWLSVPMGAGLFLTRHTRLPRTAFATEPSPYMPESAEADASQQPYLDSFQWSRRFMGLKLYLTLLIAGESGYQEVLRHQIAMGQLLRRRLLESGWSLFNDTPFPVVNFYDEALRERGIDPQAVADAVADTKRAWITTTVSTYRNQKLLRAGIPNFATQEEHIERLVTILDGTRDAILS